MRFSPTRSRTRERGRYVGLMVLELTVESVRLKGVRGGFCEMMELRRDITKPGSGWTTTRAGEECVRAEGFCDPSSGL